MAGGYVSLKDREESSEEMVEIIKERIKKIVLKYVKKELIVEGQ